MKKSKYIFNWLFYTTWLTITLGVAGLTDGAPHVGNIEVLASQVAVEATTISPTPTPALEFESDIHRYIYEVYGEHYDKALLVLSGVQDVNGKLICGGENRGLNPKAVYENKREDGTVWSRDRGIFQINSAYHPLTDEQAFDYKQNIDYSFRMFKNDGYTFSKRWAAGLCLKDHGYDI